MSHVSLKKMFDFCRPLAIVIYSFGAAIGLYALKHSLLPGKENTLLEVVTLNIGCGIVFLLGWYVCLAWAVKSFKLTQTFPSRLQYILMNLICAIPIKAAVDLYIRWQLKPFFYDEGMPVLVSLILGAVLTLIIFTVIVGLFMMQCQLPAKITFCPAENTVFSVVAYILLYGLCGILLYASAEAVYLGIYHDAALFWMMIYTMISVSSGRINRKKTGDGK